jgi:uncharacterized protein
MASLVKSDFVLTSEHRQRPFGVDARYPPTEQPKPVVVFVHGFKGFKDWGHFNLLAENFARAGFVYVKLNLSHNGTTPDSDDLVDMEAFGQNNFSIELDDIGTLLDHLFSGHSPIPVAEMDLQRLALIGHSRGGIVLLKAAEDERVQAVVTWAGISDLDQRWSKEVMESWKQEGVQWVLNARIGQNMPLYYQLAEDYLANKDRFSIQAAVRRLRQPLLVLHGEQDETLPVQMARDLHAWHWEAELVLLPEATHTFGGKHPFPDTELPADAKQVADLSIEFLRKVLDRG